MHHTRDLAPPPAGVSGKGESVAAPSAAPPTSSVLGISQSAHLPTYSSESAVGALRSTGITPLLHYYGPLRLPARPSHGYVFPPNVAGLSRTTPGLPGSSTDLSARAVPSHPGRPDGCTRSLLPHRRLASPFPAGWPPPSCVTRPNRVRFRYGSRVCSTSASAPRLLRVTARVTPW